MESKSPPDLIRVRCHPRRAPVGVLFRPWRPLPHGWPQWDVLPGGVDVRRLPETTPSTSFRRRSRDGVFEVRVLWMRVVGEKT